MVGIIFLAMGCSTCVTGNRIRFQNSSANHQPVSLALDTGSSASVLFSREARRLKIHSNPADVVLTVNQQSSKASMWVATFAGREIEGFIGWPSVRENLLWFDPARHYVEHLEALPSDIKTWTHWRIIPNSILIAEVLTAQGLPSAVLIDTGSRDEIQLSPEELKSWKKTRQPIHLDSVTLFDHSVAAIDPKLFTLLHSMRPGPPAVLGVAALNQLEMIVDAHAGYIHVRAYPGSKSKIANWTVSPEVKIVNRVPQK